MSEDIAMVLTLGIGCVVFITTHILVFRFISKGTSVYWLLNAFVGSLVVSWIVGFFVIANIFGVDMLFFYVIYMVLMGLLVLAYMFGIFTLIDSSIRLKFFFDIANKRSGISEKKLLEENNARRILTRRLSRLKDSGEIILQKGKYIRSKSYSLILVRESVARFFEKLYH